MLSVSSWESRRARVTPSASRTATSRRRRSARASSRFATLAAAIRSTIAATPLTQRATLESALGFGPRSASTDAMIARGFAISMSVVRGAMSIWC